MTHPYDMSYDAPPPKLSKNIRYLFFRPLMIYLEGKKSTPVRTGAPVRELATGRAGVEFLLDAGGVVACPSDGATGAARRDGVGQPGRGRFRE